MIWKMLGFGCQNVNRHEHYNAGKDIHMESKTRVMGKKSVLCFNLSRLNNTV